MAEGATSVGQIGLDLVVNKGEFNKEMAGLQSVAKKAGAAIAAAFGIKKLADFSKECIQLGSDLSEVQNVVDVTFTSMSSKVDKFAQNAAKQFGLSETMAKRYVGTFGAMSKAFGFSEKQAYDMSTALTGLAGDVASFYNIGQDEAYTKLKSVFTGETESLKDLGVVMTQTALDQFALQNGFGKTTKAMNEQEKVALRYAFVQNQLATAAGDFSRTSGSWANQVRLLSLQFESLKAAVGQGLIAVFTPVIRVVNSLISRLLTAINAVRALFAAFGKASKGVKDLGGKLLGLSDKSKKTTNDTQNLTKATEDSGSAANSMGDTASSSGGKASKAANKAANAAKKAAKQMRSLMGFDQINKVDKKDSSDSSGGGGGGGGLGGGDMIDTGNIEKASKSVDKLSKKMKALLARAKQLKKLFLKGFRIGFGDSQKNIEKIKKYLQDIKKDLIDIFTDKNVVKAANRYLDRMAESFGKEVGAFASIGVTIATNIIGGFRLFLNKRKKQIKKWIIDMFDVSGDIAEIKANFAVAVADVFSVFAGKDGQRITSNLMTIIWDIFSTAILYSQKFSRDILSALTKPFTDNKSKIKKALGKTLNVIADDLDSISYAVEKTSKAFGKLYDKHIKPFIDDVGSGISKITGDIFDGYNKHFAPVLKKLSGQFGKTIRKDVVPMIREFMKVIGKLFDLLRPVLNKIIIPYTRQLVKNLIPVIAKLIGFLGSSFIKKIKMISTIMTFQFKIFSKMLTVLKKLLSPIKEFSKHWGDIKSKNAKLTTEVKEKVEGTLEKISGAWEVIKDKTVQLVAEAKEKAVGTLKSIKQDWDDLTDKMVSATVSLVKKGWSTIQEFAGGDVYAYVKRKSADGIKALSEWGGDVYAYVKRASASGIKALSEWGGTVYAYVKRKSASGITALSKWGGTVYAYVRRTSASGIKALSKWGGTVYAYIIRKLSRRSKTLAQIVGTSVTVAVKLAKGWFGSGLSIIKGWLGLGKASGGIYKGGRWSPIQTYATGGSPNQGQMFIAREKGPELVGSLGGHTAVMNNDQIVASVSAGVAKAVSAAMGNFAHAIYASISNLTFQSKTPTIDRAPRLEFARVTTKADEMGQIGEILGILRRMQEGSGNSEILSLLRQILAMMGRLADRPIYLDGKDVTDRVVKRINDTTRSTGHNPILV